MKRKLLSALLCLALCASLLPGAAAEEDFSPPQRAYDPDTMRWGLEDYVDGVGFVTILPAEYDYISSFTDGFAVARKIVTSGDDWHYDYCLIDWKGNFVLPSGKYAYIEMGEDGIALVRDLEGRRAYFRPADSTFITDFCLLEDYPFYQLGVNKKLVDGRELYGAVDRNGETVIPFEYDYISQPEPAYYEPHILSAEKDGKYGAFHYDGSVLRRFIYPSDTALTLSLSLPAQMTEEEELNALIAASQTWEPYLYDGEGGNGLWGYTATQYDTEYPPSGSIFWAVFASAQPFDETGHAQVTDRDGRVGTIDQSGNFTPAPLNDRFSDVLAGCWYDRGVTTCAERGVMVGTGEGRFSPAAELTAAECLTLAVRLYDLRRGGDGTLEKAPEEWGKYTLTLADGTTWTRYGEVNDFFYDGYSSPGYPGGFYFVNVLAPGDTAEERMAWAKAHEGSAVFTAEGVAYSGTVTADEGDYYGPALRFTSGELPNTASPLSNCKPGPERWYRDAVYTAERLGLREADGFSSLLNYLSTFYPDTNRARRENFAKALAVAAGTLEKKYDVPRIPDLPQRNEQNEGIYSLYEAGILGGTDSFGTFQADKELTRAECAVMVARVLDPTQRLTTPPATPNGYEQAVIDLRSKLGHHNEQRFDTGECTIFIYDRGGFMNAPTGAMTVIYKPGSQPGDGYVLELPHVRNGWSVTPADTMVFDPEKGTFTYSYFYETTAWDSSIQGYDSRIEPGTVTFTVDLPTGTVHREHRGIDYAGAMAHVTRKEAAQTLEAPDCTVVLTKGRYGEYDDYALFLVGKSGSALGDGAIRQLILPSTVCDSIYSGYKPTDRAPDSLALSEDGLTLRYTYYFDEALTVRGDVLHEAGEYIYTADLATGEVTASIDPLSQQNLAYHGVLGSLETEEGYEVEYSYHSYGTFRLPDGVETVLRSRACASDPEKRDYEFWLVRREGDPQSLRLALPSTEVLPDGSAPTTREPDSVKTYPAPDDPNKVKLVYSYRFTEPLWNGGTLLHDKGTYVYTVDVTTGEQSVVLEDSYWKALADLTWNSDDRPFQLEQQLEAEACTIVLGMTKAIQYPQAVLALVYKDGSAKGAGEVVYLPTLSGSARYDTIAPHSLSLNEEKTVLTYVYQFDENQYAMFLSGMSYRNHLAGTYTYTVDLATGEVTDTFTPKE